MSLACFAEGDQVICALVKRLSFSFRERNARVAEQKEINISVTQEPRSSTFQGGSFQQQGCGLMGRPCNFRIDVNALFSFLISNMMFEIGEFKLS